jgi:hypothetical protein
MNYGISNPVDIDGNCRCDDCTGVAYPVCKLCGDDIGDEAYSEDDDFNFYHRSCLEDEELSETERSGVNLMVDEILN